MTLRDYSRPPISSQPGSMRCAAAPNSSRGAPQKGGHERLRAGVAFGRAMGRGGNLYRPAKRNHLRHAASVPTWSSCALFARLSHRTPVDPLIDRLEAGADDVSIGGVVRELAGRGCPRLGYNGRGTGLGRIRDPSCQER